MLLMEIKLKGQSETNKMKSRKMLQMGVFMEEKGTSIWSHLQE